MANPYLARELATHSWILAAIALTLCVLARNLPNVKPGAKAMGAAGACSIAANAFRQTLRPESVIHPFMFASTVPPLCMVVIAIIMLFRPDENRYVWLASYVSVVASVLTVIGVLIR